MNNQDHLITKAGKILIVDDEPYNIRVLQLKFENAGYTVISATNGLDGLNKFKTECPDIIISDIKMPVMNGKEMCQAIKEVGNANKIFIIVMTSTIDQPERLWVSDINNACLVEKPISPNLLLALVEKNMNKCASE